ncbi:MAG: Uma2 family endonuclease [Hyphomicrobium sp.]
MTKAAFFAWAQGRQGHWELKDGSVVMHPGGSRRHGTIIGRFVGLLIARLDPSRWSVVPTELAIEIGTDIRYPDVLIEHASQEGDALSTASPVVLVEVLSPSSIGTDMVIKLAEYTSLASLEAYIVASQDEPILWVWQRSAHTRAFPALPTEIKGRDASVDIAALAIALPLAELYRGIGPA